jgi:RNA polymerase sigma factor (sigma-70 family)
MHFDASLQDPYPLPPEGFAGWELRAADAAVRAFLAVQGGIRGLKVDDLVQETLAASWEARRTYDASRGANPKTYFNHVARGALVDLRRTALAQKRGRGVRPQSLDAPLDADDAESDTLHDRTAGTLAGTDPEAASEQALLAEAIAQVQDRLGFSAEDRRLLALSAAGFTPTQMERITGDKQTTITSRLKMLHARLRSPELAGLLRPFLD